MILSKRGTRNTSHGSGDRIITSFLTEMDGILSKDSLENVFIIAVTSRIVDVDPAVIRPGRLDIHIRIPLPDLNSRRSILKQTLEVMPSELNESDVNEIADSLENYSSGDLVNLCREAAMNAIRDGKSLVTRNNFFISSRILHEDETSSILKI
jgi:transitional endoplasmic reticulum ATPase